MGLYRTFLHNKLQTIAKLISSETVVKNNTASSEISMQMKTAHQAVGADSFDLKKYQGERIGIAILDTGVSPVLDFVQPYNRITAFVDFVHGRKAPYDDNGHGTHVTETKIIKLLFLKTVQLTE